MGRRWLVRRDEADSRIADVVVYTGCWPVGGTCSCPPPEGTRCWLMMDIRFRGEFTAPPWCSTWLWLGFILTQHKIYNKPSPAPNIGGRGTSPLFFKSSTR